jgi:hypothetical protein
VADAATLAALVRESAPRFFLRNGVPLEITGVLRGENGESMSAALEQPTVEAIEAGCRAAGYRLRAIVPAAVALTSVARDAAFVWCDGDTTLEMEAGGAVGTARRRATVAAASQPEHPPVHALLVPFGEDAWRFSDALGAAIAPADAPLALRSTSRADAATSRKRVWRAAGAAAVAMLLAIFAPPVANALARARADRGIAAIAARARDAARVEQDLRRMTAALSEASAFGASRRSAARLLIGIDRALPASAALVAFDVDSAGGTLVLLAPRAARAVAALDSVRGIAAPEIVGPVTRETIGTRELERASVRFSLAAGGDR